MFDFIILAYPPPIPWTAPPIPWIPSASLNPPLPWTDPPIPWHIG